MSQAIGLMMVMTIWIGIMDAGKDLMEVMVRLAQVATEKLTLNQIGKTIMMHNIEKGHKLTFPELPALLRAEITRGGKDTTKDTWGTGYYLEIATWRGLSLKTSDEFILCSAGPDKKWWTQDDELWYNFFLEEKYLFSKPGKDSLEKDVDLAKAKLGGLRKKTEDGIATIRKFLGLKPGEVPTIVPGSGAPAPTGPAITSKPKGG